MSTFTMNLKQHAYLIPWFALAVFGCGASEQRPAALPKAPSSDEAKAQNVEVTPPGSCVDPISDGDQHDATRPFDKHVQLDVHAEDLEGDGVVDEFVMPAWSCGQACIRSAYLMRGTCGHYLGSFPSTNAYEAIAHKSHGLKDLSTHPRTEEADGLHCYQAILTFDGTQYRESKRRECECKDEGAKCTSWDAGS
ncbi:MAG: hypothetical protein NVS3B20_02600 [Polyangiales bacterium]